MVFLELINFRTERQQAKKASPEYETMQATYLKSRLVELDRIRVLDANYRSQLAFNPAPPGVAMPLPQKTSGKIAAARTSSRRADFELGQSYRRGRLSLRCVEVSSGTGRPALARILSVTTRDG